MKKDAMKRLVIVGGGVSGYLLLMNLLRFHKSGPAEIILLEKESLERVGLAYSTDDDFHLLNVPASNMSAFADDKEHFTSWLQQNGYAYSLQSFVPRKIYRKYILSSFKALMDQKPAQLHIHLMQDEAIDVDVNAKTVLLKNGAPLRFDTMVLAVGSFPPDPLGLTDKAYIDSPNYHHSAWERSAYEGIKSNDSVFIIGTGLTMVDTVARLHSMQHAGSIIALSRHGLIPATHHTVKPYPSFYGELAGNTSMLEIFRIVRRHLHHAAKNGLNWRAVLDSMRSYTPALWMELPGSEKKSFMEHLRHIWDASRHRMPHESSAMMQEMLESGKAKIIAGRITAIACRPDGSFDISYRERGTRQVKSLHSNVIINCMGPSGSYKNIKSVLITNLLNKGVLAADAFRLGVNCTHDGAVVGSDGIASNCIFTIGSPRKGVLWETTAIPEIRLQAQQLAQWYVQQTVIDGVLINK
jgi:uncharacterized NAD(P)/FAD-binding protein YdhS